MADGGLVLETVASTLWSAGWTALGRWFARPESGDQGDDALTFVGTAPELLAALAAGGGRRADLYAAHRREGAPEKGLGGMTFGW
jgi:hypothetical protein